MDHPSIAKVFDAGATAQGRPYFVMEYVAETPITDYCDRHKLSMDARLALFTHICEGGAACASEGNYSPRFEGFEAQKRTVGARHASTVQSVTQLGAAFSGLGRYPEAEKAFREALDAQRRAAFPSDPDFWRGRRDGPAGVEISQKSLGSNTPYMAEITYHEVAVEAL